MMDDKWRPIESAPRDGTRVLVMLADGQYGVAYWQPETHERWETLREDREVIHKVRRIEDTSYWAVAALEGEYYKPTHWMPLPAPPLPTPDGGER